jgi:hypothetical protein
MLLVNAVAAGCPQLVDLRIMDLVVGGNACIADKPAG